MKITTLEGVVENGRICLPNTVKLPEKAKVYVIVPDVEVPSVAYIGSPRLVHPEQANDFEMEVTEENDSARV
jgi:hypothetical protein